MILHYILFTISMFRNISYLICPLKILRKTRFHCSIFGRVFTLSWPNRTERESFSANEWRMEWRCCGGRRPRLRCGIRSQSQSIDQRKFCEIFVHNAWISIVSCAWRPHRGHVFQQAGKTLFSNKGLSEKLSQIFVFHAYAIISNDFLFIVYQNESPKKPFPISKSPVLSCGNAEDSTASLK